MFSVNICILPGPTVTNIGVKKTYMTTKVEIALGGVGTKVNVIVTKNRNIFSGVWFDLH